MIYNDSYKGLDDLGEAVERTVKALTVEAHRFDFIAVRGCSGMLVGAPVSLRIGKPLVVVRKPDENSHSYGRSVINDGRARGRYLFLDDFVSSGTTERAVIDGLRVAAPSATYVGNFQYCRNWEEAGGGLPDRYLGEFVWQSLEDVANDDAWASVA
jgi:hypothetical protein